jgi:hypothetical protein
VLLGNPFPNADKSMPHKVFSFQPNHLFMGMGDLCRILPHKIPGKVQLNMPFRFI